MGFSVTRGQWAKSAGSGSDGSEDDRADGWQPVRSKATTMLQRIRIFNALRRLSKAVRIMAPHRREIEDREALAEAGGDPAGAAEMSWPAIVRMDVPP